MVEIRGVMTDCPDKLSTGIGLIVTLRIYLIASAFKPLKSTRKDAENVQLGFNEGLETQEERWSNQHDFVAFLWLNNHTISSLRERKNAISKLFEVVSLNPQAGVNFASKKSDVKAHEEALKKLAGRPVKKIKEIVGDGEEIEVEDAEDLSKNDIDAIYSRFVQFFSDHMRKYSTWTAGRNITIVVWARWNLRSPLASLCAVIKSKLYGPFLIPVVLSTCLTVCSWMHSLETGTMNAREATSMHPLWSE